MPTTPLRITEEPKYPINQSANELHTSLKCLSTKSLLRRQSSSTRDNTIRAEDTGDWSNDILAEFNSIIANEINELTKEKTRREFVRRNDDVRVVQYKELLNEFGISDSENSDQADSPRDNDSGLQNHKDGKSLIDDDCRCLLNSDYDEPHDRVVPDERKSGSLPENLQDIIGTVDDGYHHADTLNSDYDEPANCLPMNSIRNQIDRIASSLPSKLERKFVLKDAHLNPYRVQPKTTVELSLRANEGIDVIDTVQTGLFRNAENDFEESNAKLPPRQHSERKISLPINLMSQKRRKASRLQKICQGQDDHDISMDPDYDDVFLNEEIGRSRSLDNRVLKSAPVTPTEEKKQPFAKLLRKRHNPIFHGSSDDVILVSVSSLPNQDLLRMKNDRTCETKNSKTNMKEALIKNRAVSPFTLRNDVSAKRLSESDKDVRQISPVNRKKLLLEQSWSNDVAVSCDLPENNGIINGHCVIANGNLSKLEHNEMKRILENAKTASVSVLYSLLH